MNAEQHKWYWRGYNDAKKEDKSEFVGLTDEERHQVMQDRTWMHMEGLCLAIEAKLKEKNT
jgi:hypothetical protein